MISPRYSKTGKCLVLLDNATPEWVKEGRVTPSGLQKLVGYFMRNGISLDDVTFACLTDTVDKPKSADYKIKHELIKEMIEVSAPNLIVTVGAQVFEKVSMKKGVSKYYKRPIKAALYGDYKCLALPNPQAATYDPDIVSIIEDSISMIKTEMEFPEIVEKEKIETNYHIINSISKFDKWLEYYKSSAVPAFSFDTETSSFDWCKGQLLMMTFSHREGASYLIPSTFYGHWTPEEWDHIKNGLIELFSDEKKLWIVWNGKFDFHWMHRHVGVPIKRYGIFDGCIASFCINETVSHGLKDNSAKYTDLGNYDDFLEEEKAKYCKERKIKMKDFSYSYLDFDTLAHYALQDSDATFRLWKVLEPKLKEEEQEEVFKIMMDNSWMLFHIEEAGWKVDLEYCKKYHAELTEEINILELELASDKMIKRAEELISSRELIKVNAKRKTKLKSLPQPITFNFNSIAHKKVLCFEVLKLPIIKYVKNKDRKSKEKNPALDKEVIKAWCKDHDIPVLQKFARYQEIVKARSTYVEAVMAKEYKGRVHATFNLTSAKTGRLSSSGGLNMQNISTHGKEGKKIKRMFIVEDGCIGFCSDLAAAEVRAATLMSNDTKMIDIFNNTGGFVHEAVAKAIFNLDVALEDIKELYPKERQIAKSISFLLLYGGSSSALANATGITRERAEEIIQDYFDTYTGISDWIKTTHEFIRQNGYSVSLLGRKRRVPGVFSEDGFVVERALRMGLNAIVQSFGADCLNISSCNILAEILDRKLPFKLISTVHDCIYLEIPEDMVEEAKELVERHLSKFPVENAPIELVGDTEVGYSWDTFTNVDDFLEELRNTVDEADEENSEEEEEE